MKSEYDWLRERIKELEAEVAQLREANKLFKDALQKEIAFSQSCSEDIRTMRATFRSWKSAAERAIEDEVEP